MSMKPMREQAVRLNPFMRCECGKLHTRDYAVKWSAYCTCGRLLAPQAWEEKK